MQHCGDVQRTGPLHSATQRLRRTEAGQRRELPIHCAHSNKGRFSNRAPQGPAYRATHTPLPKKSRWRTGFKLPSSYRLAATVATLALRGAACAANTRTTNNSLG